MVVERVGPQPVGHVALELRHAALEHEMPPQPRPLGQRLEQPRLADPRRPEQGDAGGAWPVERVQRPVQHGQLGIAAHHRRSAPHQA
ncbi:MAG TPA: hypothetical protein VFZ00_05925 [Solirubrobacter sp.]|nr:hypothetical protein [Solirubrobacter sp.]